MTRQMICAGVFLALSGCQSALHSTPPPDLSQRLDEIRRERLAAAAASPHDGLGWSDIEVRSQVRANHPLTLASAGTAAPSSPAVRREEILTLGDVWDETQPPPPPPGEQKRTEETRSSKTSSDDGYVRKPPLPSFFDTVKRDVQDLPSDLWRDTKRVYANPVNLAILGVAYGGSLAVQESGPDSTVEHRFNRNNDLRAPDHIFGNSDWRDAFAAAGNPGTHFALAGVWYLLGQQSMNEKTYEVGKTLFSALAINGVTVMVGQAASWDRAPNGEMGTFPSGHTSSSFVMASVLHEAYGHVVGVPLYGLATLVAVERLDDREHYFSDVLMGAVLGTVIGHSVASGRDPQFFGWKLVPWASPQNGSGLAFVKTFK